MSTSLNGTTLGQDLQALIDLLDLEPIDTDLFRSRHTGTPGKRLYGGEVAAQALVAAERTTDPELVHVHSLHAYFLRPGDAGARVVYRVDRLQDGRNFRRRRVTAVQNGEPILCLEASFTTDCSLAGNHDTPPPVPGPDECPPAGDTFPNGSPHPARMFELRSIDTGQDAAHPFLRDLWVRPRGEGVAGRVSAPAVLTYLSDLSLASAVLLASGRDDVSHLTSLDHVMWFHNRVRLDDWLLYSKSSPSVGGLRGLAQGRIFHRDGTLIASVGQEGLMHVKR